MPEIEKETEELIDSINTARKETLDAYTQGVRNLLSMPMEKMWEEGIQSTEEIVKQSLKAQNEVSAALLDRLRNMDNLPDEAVTLVTQMHDMNKTVYSAQQDMLNACLEVVKALDPGKFAGSTGSLIRMPVDRLKSVISRVLDINMRLLSGVSKQLEEPKRTTTKKTTSKSSSAKEE